MSLINWIITLMSFHLFTFYQHGFAHSDRDTLSILFIGNSYTYFSNLPQIAPIISDSTKTKLITRKSTAGGARLSQHWKGERGLRTKGIIKNGHSDIIILQEQAWEPLNMPIAS